MSLSKTRSQSTRSAVKALNDMMTPQKKESSIKRGCRTPLRSPLSGSDKENCYPETTKQRKSTKKQLAVPFCEAAVNEENMLRDRRSTSSSQKRQFRNSAPEVLRRESLSRSVKAESFSRSMKAIVYDEESSSDSTWTIESKSPRKLTPKRSFSRSTTAQREIPKKNSRLEEEYDNGDKKTCNPKNKKSRGLETEYDSDEGSNYEKDQNVYGLESEYEESNDSDSTDDGCSSKNKKRVETFEEEPKISELNILLTSISKLEFDVMQEDATRRTEQRLKRENNPLMKIYPIFHTSALPDILLKREEQCKEIESFIKHAVASNSSVHNRSIYISGVPGTGKTACVTKVVNKLQSKPKPVVKFDYVYINGLELVKPEHIFTEIFKALYPSTRSISSKTARDKLSKIFAFDDPKRPPILLTIDELDMLCNKSQDVVYDIFDWASTEAARLSVIAIANTLDLPERVLKNKVSSRLGYNRLTFQPYTYEEITHILEHRVKKSNVSLFKKGAFGLIARKVAAVSGDLRKALEFIRRSIEIAVDNCDKQLTIQHANAAVNEGLQSLPILFTKSLSTQQVALLRSIIQEFRATSLAEMDFFLLYESYRRICISLAIEPMEMCVASNMLLLSLQKMGYIDIKANGLASRRITLKISADEIEFLLRQIGITEEK